MVLTFSPAFVYGCEGCLMCPEKAFIVPGAGFDVYSLQASEVGIYFGPGPCASMLGRAEVGLDLE